MASKGKISEFIDIKAVEQQFKVLNENLNISIVNTEKIVSEAVKMNLAFKDAKGIKELTDNYIKLNKAEQDGLIKQERLLQVTANREKAELSLATAVKKQTENANKQQTEYQKLSQTHTILRNKAKDLAVQYGLTDKRTIEATKSANLYDKKLKEIDKSLGQSQRNVGNYADSLGMVGGKFGGAVNSITRYNGILASGVSGLGNAFKGLGGALKTLFLNPVFLVIAGISAAGIAIKALIQNSMEFSSTMSNVKAVSGATAEEMVLLKKNAKELGATTLKTATEVAKLQFELSKLGFTVPEIINSTKAITDLSIATGSSMARSAEVLGTTIRSMGLDASESGRVADVMAKSFSSSALDMEKFAESFKYVGPIAKTTNTSLEETSAMLAVLANAGISGSNSGTALRMIMLKLGEQSGTLTEKITKLSKEGLRLADANNEVGQRAMTALLVLAQQSDQLPEFTKKFQNASGAVAEMSRIMSDNLEGDITLMKSAWDGFMMSIEDGDGILAKLARMIIGHLTSVVTHFTILSTAIGKGIDYLVYNFDIVKGAVASFGKATEAVLTSVGNAWDALGKGDFKGVALAFDGMGDSIADAFSPTKWKSIADQNKAIKDLESTVRSKAKTDKKNLEDEALAAKEKQAELDRLQKLKDKELKRIEDAYKLQRKLDNKYSIDKIEGIKTTNNNALEEEVAYFAKLKNFTAMQLFEEGKKYDAKKTIFANFRTDSTNQLMDLYATEEELTARHEEIKQQIKDKAFEVARAGIDALSAFQNIGFQNDLALIDERAKKDDEAREKELKAAGNNQALKDKINAKYDAAEKKRETERKKVASDKAKADKATAIMNIILSTAEGIAKSWTLLPPMNFINAAAVGVAGALQLGVALATPIPKYKDGIKNNPTEHYGIAGEAGTELWQHNGQSTLVDKPSLIKLGVGDSIIPNYELYKNSAFDNVPTMSNTFNMELQGLSNDIRSLQSGFIMVAETVKNKRELHLNITKSGFETLATKGNSVTKYVNNKYRD